MIGFWQKIKNLLQQRETYELGDVFTPASSARVAYIERTNVEKQLEKALGLKGKQIVIYGHSGSGKTTVLTHMLKEKKIEHIISRCTNTSTIESIILDAFDELNPYYIESKANEKTDIIKGEISSEYMGIKSAISGTMESSMHQTHKRVLPPQLTMQRLAHFIGEAQAIWIIEDFHKVAPSEKTKISQMMKLFMDMSNKYPKIKIVILGAADNGYEVVAHDRELNNRVAEIEVPLLNEIEIKKILEKGTKALNVEFSEAVINDIVKYSNCLATITHQLAYNLCFNEGIKSTMKKCARVEADKLEQAISDFSEEKQDTYKNTYYAITKHRESKFKNVEIILETLCVIDKPEVSMHELYDEILKIHFDYPQSNLSTYVKRLTTIDYEEVLRNNAGRISFSDPFFKAYVKIMFKGKK